MGYSACYFSEMYMALIDCPSCAKKISDKAKVCQHCDFTIGNVSAEELLRRQNLTRNKKIQSVQTQSIIAMLLFVAGFGVMYWGGVRPDDTRYTLAMTCSAAGFIWYIVNRIRLIYLKRSN